MTLTLNPTTEGLDAAGWDTVVSGIAIIAGDYAHITDNDARHFAITALAGVQAQAVSRRNLVLKEGNDAGQGKREAA